MQTFLRDGRWLTAEEVEAYNTSNQSVVEPDDTDKIEIINTPVEKDLSDNPDKDSHKNNKKK